MIINLSIVAGITIVFMILSRRVIRSNSNVDNEKYASYYWGNKIKKKSTLNNCFDDYFLYIYMYIVAVPLLCAISFGIFSKIPSLVNTGPFIDEILGIMLSTFLGVFAVVGITISINKKQYISYNVYDIMDRAKIRIWINILIYLIGFTFILNYTCALLQNSDLGIFFLIIKSMIFYNFVYFIVISLNICRIVGSVIFSTTNFELKILDDLYFNFRYTDVPIVKSWNVEGAKPAIDYLLSRYNNYLKKIKIKNIKYVKFDSLIKYINPVDKKNKKTDSKPNSSLLIRLSFQTVFFYCFFWIILLQLICGWLLLLLNRSYQLYYSVISIFVFLVQGVLIYKNVNTRSCLVRSLYERCGYFINNKYIHAAPFFHTKLWHYVKYLKCILSYYEMALNKKHGANSILKINGIQIKNRNERVDQLIINAVHDNCKLNDDNDDGYILLTLILFIYYKYNNDISKWDDDYKDKLKEVRANKSIIYQPETITSRFVEAIYCDIIRMPKPEKPDMLNMDLFKSFQNIIVTANL